MRSWSRRLHHKASRQYDTIASTLRTNRGASPAVRRRLRNRLTEIRYTLRDQMPSPHSLFILAPPRSGLRMRTLRGGARYYVKKTINRPTTSPIHPTSASGRISTGSTSEPATRGVASRTRSLPAAMRRHRPVPYSSIALVGWPPPPGSRDKTGIPH